MNTLNNNPLVSVIMPVYNGEKYLDQSIESIFSQTYHPFEIILVDDGSTDNSRKIASSYPEIKYIHQENAGHAAARNRGIESAEGSYIALLDADDLWLPAKLSLQITAFSDDPDLDLVTGHIKQFISPELKIDSAGPKINEFQPVPGYMTSAIMMNRKFLKKVGLFHENVRIAEFISWFSWVLEHNPKMKVLPDLIALRRIHGGNISLQRKDEKNQMILRILKSSLDRKHTQK